MSQDGAKPEDRYALPPPKGHDLPAPRYDELDRALSMLRENQAALLAGSASLSSLVAETSSQVAALEASTTAWEHCPGLPEQAVGRLHEQLTTADVVDVKGLRIQCDVVEQRLADMTQQKERIAEQSENVSTSNDAAATALGEQAQKADETETSRKAVEEEMQPVKEKTGELAARIAELQAQTDALNTAKAGISNVVDVEYSARWADAAGDVRALQRRLVAQRKEQLERTRGAISFEAGKLYQYGSSSLAEAFSDRRVRSVHSWRRAHLEATTGCALHAVGVHDEAAERVMLRGFFSAWRAGQHGKQRVAAALRRLERLEQSRSEALLSRWAAARDLEAAVAAKCKAIADVMPRAEAHLTDVAWPASIEAVEARLAQLRLVDQPDADACVEAGAAVIEELSAPLGDEAEGLLTARRAHLEQVVGQIHRLEDGRPDRANRVAALGRTCADGRTTATLLAEKAAMYSVAEDVLLLWNSVKSLEACKADRGALAKLVEDENELAVAQNVAVAGFDAAGAEAFAAAVGRLGAHHDGAEHSLAPVVSSHTEKFRALQEVLRKLSFFVEEMVTKLTELSAQSRSRLRSGAMLRTGGGYRGAASKHDKAIRLPAPPPLDSGGSLKDGCERWLEYARAMLDEPAQ